jgi:hypothetical protein
VKEAESSRLVHGKLHSHPDAYVRGDRQSVGEGRFLLGEALGSTSVSLCAGACRERSQIYHSRQCHSGTCHVLCHLSKLLRPQWKTITSHRVMSIGIFCPPKLRSANLVPMGGAHFISTFCHWLSADICCHDSIHGITFLSFDGSSTTDTFRLETTYRSSLVAEALSPRPRFGTAQQVYQRGLCFRPVVLSDLRPPEKLTQPVAGIRLKRCEGESAMRCAPTLFRSFSFVPDFDSVLFVRGTMWSMFSLISPNRDARDCCEFSITHNDM